MGLPMDEIGSMLISGFYYMLGVVAVASATTGVLVTVAIFSLKGCSDLDPVAQDKEAARQRVIETLTTEQREALDL